MSAVAGLLSSTSAQANDLVGEFQETIFVRNAKGLNVGTTLFGLMAKLKTEPADNIEFNWFERDPVRRVFTTNPNSGIANCAGGFDSTAGTSTTSTKLLFYDGKGTGVSAGGGGSSDASTTDGEVNHLLCSGQILRNDRTGEYIRITADPTVDLTQVTVTRGYNGSGAAAIQTTDTWTLITLAKDEGADPVRATYEDPSSLINYVQTFNSTVYLANAFKGQVMRSDIEGPLTDRRIQALERIARDIEYAFLLGRKVRLAGTNGWVYTTGGVYDSLASNASLAGNLLDGSNTGTNGTGVSGSVKLSVFNTWMQNFMTYGSDAKLAFCGPTAYSVLSTFANSATNGYRIMQGEQVFGMHITTINTPFGELSLAYHPLLKESPTFSTWLFAVDLPMIVQKTFEPLFLEPDIQTPGQDSYKEQYRAKLGLKLKFANAFGVANTVSGIAA